MFIIIIGLFLCGLILYKISDYYSRRYLGFNSINHVPVCTPGSSLSPTLVCVLGWGGCTRRQLRRLLEFYALHDISTISWINPMFDYIFGVDIKQVEHVLDLLLEQQTSKIIIIHLHSNNGAIVWGHMIRIMKTNERYKHLLSDIKGVILDSAPFVHLNNSTDWMIGSAVGTSRACVSIILNRVQYFHFIWTPLISYYLSTRYFYRRYFSSDSSTSSDKVQQLLNKTPTCIDQYYLYSNADRLIPHQIIG
jgi:hypothetical protein